MVNCILMHIVSFVYINMANCHLIQAKQNNNHNWMSKYCDPVELEYAATWSGSMIA